MRHFFMKYHTALCAKLQPLMKYTMFLIEQNKCWVLLKTVQKGRLDTRKLVTDKMSRLTRLTTNNWHQLARAVISFTAECKKVKEYAGSSF